MIASVPDWPRTTFQSVPVIESTLTISLFDPESIEARNGKAPGSRSGSGKPSIESISIDVSVAEIPDVSPVAASPPTLKLAICQRGLELSLPSNTVADAFRTPIPSRRGS